MKQQDSTLEKGPHKSFKFAACGHRTLEIPDLKPNTSNRTKDCVIVKIDRKVTVKEKKWCATRKGEKTKNCNSD